MAAHPDTRNIRTQLRAICMDLDLDVKNNDDRIPALLDLLDPKDNEDASDGGTM